MLFPLLLTASSCFSIRYYKHSAPDGVLLERPANVAQESIHAKQDDEISGGALSISSVS